MNKALLCTIVIGVGAVCFGGEAQKWENLPEAVRKTVVSNGGKEGMAVDKESETKNGLAVFEAGVKGNDGNINDLVITADGTLVETKTDDAADAAQERVGRAKKLLKGVKFSHPTRIDNPYLPLSSLKQDVLEGSEDGKKVRVERTMKPEVKRTFKIGEQWVESLVMEDREWEDGKLAEVTLDYFAQDDAGNVYYLGEDVDEYKNDKIVGHEGSWAVGRDTPVPGIIITAHPKKGQEFFSEDVSSEITEKDEVTSVKEAVNVPVGEFADCVKIKESPGDGTTEWKYYAKGVGVVREIPATGNEVLTSHETK